MSSSIDQQFVEFIVKSLVGKPDAVSIARTVDEKGVLLQLTVDQDDLGRVIGKRGATAQSMRTLLRALGTKNDARYNLKIVDVGPPPEERQKNKSRDEEKPQDDEKPVEEPKEADDTEDEAEDDEEEDQETDLASKHRKDLDDLDDLDI